MPTLPRSATWRPPLRDPQAPWVIGVAAGALLISLLYPIVAFRYSPWALPGALLIIATVWATVSRPEIGIAAALAMVPLGNFGLLDFGVVNWPPWLPMALWVTFVFVVSVTRALGREEPFPRIGVALIVYFAVIVVSFGVADSQTDALPVLRSVTVGLLLFFATAIAVRDRSSALWVVSGIAATALLQGAIAAYQYFS